MSAISEKEISLTLADITSMTSSYKNTLTSLSDMENELVSKASNLEGYNGAKVAGSNRSDYTLECTKYYCDKFNIVGASEIVSSSNEIMKEADRLDSNIETFQVEIKEMDSSLAIITIYLANIESALRNGVITFDKSYDKMNVKDKLDCASKLMIKDKDFNYSYLETTPIIRTKEMTIPLYINNSKFPTFDCKYLEYYNNSGQKVIAPLIKIKYDPESNGYKGYTYTKMSEEEINSYILQTSAFHHSIMAENVKYGKKFKDTAIKPLKQITLEYIDYDKKKVNGSNWEAYTNNNSYITFDMKYDSINEESHKFLVSAYSHELGHSFDNSITGTGSKFSSYDGFMDVYNQINEQDSDYSIIREYGHSSPSECFAECTMIYYNDPKALKEIKLASDDTPNLYEYMKGILE